MNFSSLFELSNTVYGTHSSGLTFSSFTFILTKTMSNHGHAHDCGAHVSGAPSVHQTLDEMEFERGIWSAALCGDYEEVQRHLRRGENANRTDSSGYTALVS